jgi:hypothetical protein
MGVMPEPSARLHTLLVVLTALIAPVVIAIAFIAVMDWANRPVSVAEYRSDPNGGLHEATRNNALLFLHTLAQLAFVAGGAWRITRRPRVRVAFLFVAIPVSTLVFLLSFIGLIAK